MMKVEHAGSVIVGVELRCCNDCNFCSNVSLQDGSLQFSPKKDEAPSNNILHYQHVMLCESL